MKNAGYGAGPLAGLLLGLTILLSSAAAAQASCPATLVDQPIGFDLRSLDAAVVSSRSQETALRSAVDSLVDRAEGHLSMGLLSVVQKPEAGPSGDKRDYVSLAPYWWPDPDSADGRPYIRRDGQTNPERQGENYDRVRMQTMVDRVFDLSLAAYLTDEQRFAQKAAAQIDMWFVNPDTRMNPNLQYAQSIPGRNDGRAIGIIDSRVLAEVIDAAILLKKMDALPDETEAGLKSWIAAYAAWLIRSEFGQEERAAENNHGTFYDSQLAHFLAYAGRCDLVSRVIKDTKSRVVGQIKPTGMQPLEIKRTRSLHYHAFNAEAFLRLALIADRLDIDLYDYELAASGSIRDTVHMLAGYAGRFDAWPHPRLDDGGVGTVRIALERAHALDVDDEVVSSALDRLPPASADGLNDILFYVPTDES